MKCPLFTAAEMSHEPELSPVNNDCLGEECAWWLKDVNMCAIKDIALELQHTQLRLADVIEKRPSKGEGEPK